jgi:hypothetical protein
MYWVACLQLAACASSERENPNHNKVAIRRRAMRFGATASLSNRQLRWLLLLLLLSVVATRVVIIVAFD